MPATTVSPAYGGYAIQSHVPPACIIQSTLDISCLGTLQATSTILHKSSFTWYDGLTPHTSTTFLVPAARSINICYITLDNKEYATAWGLIQCDFIHHSVAGLECPLIRANFSLTLLNNTWMVRIKFPPYFPPSNLEALRRNLWELSVEYRDSFAPHWFCQICGGFPWGENPCNVCWTITAYIPVGTMILYISRSTMYARHNMPAAGIG